jgi:uncharacterized protein (DUF58 family)
MITPELAKKIQQLKIKTRKILQGSLLSDYRVLRKGYGLEFEQLADYQLGHVIRFIDWKSSARAGKLLIKEYREERNRTVMLAVDYSASVNLATQHESKRELIATVATVLAIAAQQSKDAVGLIIFTDIIECVIPPKMGIKHVDTIIEKLFTFKPVEKKTALAAGINYLNKQKKKDQVIFLISDFIDEHLEQGLPALAKKSELIAIRCLDTTELHLPNIGFIESVDLETDDRMLLNTGAHAIAQLNIDRLERQKRIFKKYAIDQLDIRTGSDVFNVLVKYMKRRAYK